MGESEFMEEKPSKFVNWHTVLIENENGTNNKITNNINKEPIKGFYIYKR